MISFYAKLINEKVREHCKNMKKNKRNTNLFCWYINTQHYPKHNNIYTRDLKTCNLIKKTLQHRCFSVKFLRTPFDI